MKKRYWEKPPATKEKILSYIKRTLNNRRDKQEPLLLGKPSDKAAQRIKKIIGHEIRQVVLVHDAVIHTFRDDQLKKHKITFKDATRIMDIINDENTEIRISETEHQNKKPLEFIGDVNGKIFLIKAINKDRKELILVDLYRPKHEIKEKGEDAVMLAKKPPSAYVRNVSSHTKNIVNSTPNVKKNPINTKTKLQEKNSKKTLAPKKNCSTIQKEQKEKAMATKQKRKTTKRKLSPAQLAAKKAAQKKKTSTRKNPVKKKTPAKKTAARKPATRRTPARKTPASRKPTTRKNPFVAGATYTDVPEPPKFNKSKAIYVGRIPHLEYITEAGTNSPRPFKYKHEFEGELPYLVSDGNNLFIVKGNKKMHFDPKRGIVG